MQELALVVFKSPLVLICDVCCPAEFGAHEYRLDRGSLVFVRSGFFATRVSSGSYLIDSNYAVCGSEGDTLSAMPSSRTSCMCTVIRYCEDALPQGASAWSDVFLCSPGVYLQHARLLNSARLAQENTALNGAAAALLLEVACARRERYAAGEHTQIVYEIRELLNQSLANRISLLELAGRFYLSPFTISRCFHRGTGLSLRHYMQSLRLRRALTFMLDEKRNLTAIALELGFYDEAHFSKAFHAEFGTTPVLALKAFADTQRTS